MPSDCFLQLYWTKYILFLFNDGSDIAQDQTYNRVATNLCANQ
jgi:hypothetical protein